MFCIKVGYLIYFGLMTLTPGIMCLRVEDSFVCFWAKGCYLPAVFSEQSCGSIISVHVVVVCGLTDIIFTFTQVLHLFNMVTTCPWSPLEVTYQITIHPVLACGQAVSNCNLITSSCCDIQTDLQKIMKHNLVFLLILCHTWHIKTIIMGDSASYLSQWELYS